ncbi:BppU family phage baseplate upper protein [Fructobacillus tropaeoli]|uniref:BppU family phage baseplate upper protein n=1 Tax=Fructobacillus tropaeoli TaxID=709323 RepID=UPI001944F66A|nr:BppU family phage baseplate upper protein [Fructobacillus tropaeoli]GIC69556.1 BppU family phage baseplate upper protein [Fructobacillus tropaeoli]
MAVKNYAELNINITDINSTTFVPALNGRQGDNNREVFLWLKNGPQGYDLTGKTVTLFVKDASGVVKTASTMNDQTGLSTGHFSLLIPSEVYQAPGAVQDSYIQIKQNDTIITSIPVSFNVIENTMLVTQTQSQMYLDSVQKVIDDFNNRIHSAGTDLTSLENALKSVQVTIDNLNTQYNSDLFAQKGKDNEFKGNNTFDQKIIAPNGLQGKADTAGQADKSSYADKSGTADYVNSNNDQTFKSINVPGWSSFDGGVSVTNIVNNGWTNFKNGLTVSGGDAIFYWGAHSKKTVETNVWDNGLNAHIYRVGNIVVVQIYGSILTDHGAFTTIGWKIPAGFRPAYESQGIASAGYTKTIMRYHPSGDVDIIDSPLKASDNNGGDNYAYGFAVWATTDDFPS